MTCHEIEALRLGLMNSLGVDDDAARKHAREELGDEPAPHIAALADADAPAYDYLRGRLVAVRDAEAALGRLLEHGEGLLEGLGESHETLHEAFPADE